MCAKFEEAQSGGSKVIELWKKRMEKQQQQEEQQELQKHFNGVFHSWKGLKEPLIYFFDIFRFKNFGFGETRPNWLLRDFRFFL